VSPAVGGERLRAWLLADPPARDVIVARQRAVQEIAPHSDLLETCAVAGAAAGGVARRTVDAFLEWATAIVPPPRAGLLAYVAPVLTIAGVAAWLRGVPATVALGPVLFVNTSVALALQGRLRGVLAGVTDLPALLGPALALLDRWATEPLETPAWRDVQARLAAGGGSRALGRLRRVLTWSETRYSPMLHWALNATMAWDAHVLRALEGWRHACGPAVPGWLDALADAEALTALATLAHDNPAWLLPTLTDGADADGAALAATALAHPLLAPTAAVGNDARLAGPGSLLVISGSNMAGKTTLLRALGVNVVLAQAGGPVCATAMRWRPLRVRTSIHVRDALDEGVSLFLAELRRLKAIVDVADGARADDGAPVLALLDEVLHGTNSRDRRAATRAILARLHAAGAVTVITTHDLELADEPALAPTTAHLHFREQYLTGADGPTMRFDYVAREGKAVSTNAMALLAALGLGAPPPGLGASPPGPGAPPPGLGAP
jgi:hypothetical protein